MAKRPELINFMTDQELTTLHNWMNNHDSRPEWKREILWCSVLLGAGLRVNEGVNLKVEDCHPTMFHIIRGKGGKERWAEIIPELRDTIWASVEALRGRPNDYVFGSPELKFRMTDEGEKFIRLPIDVRTGWNWWKRVLEAAQVRYISPHGARKTFATWEAERLSVHDLREQLGHSNYTTTEKYYRGSIPGRRYFKETPDWRRPAGEVVDWKRIMTVVK